MILAFVIQRNEVSDTSKQSWLEFHIETCKMLIRVIAVQVCDARDDHSSNAAQYKKKTIENNKAFICDEGFR